MRNKSCFILLIIVLILTSCGQNTNTNSSTTNSKDNTTEMLRDKISATATIQRIDLESNKISFIDTTDGTKMELIFHGGVNIYNSYGSLITIDSVSLGDVVDVEYYADNFKITSMTISDRMKVLKEVTKLSVNAVDKRVTTKGISYEISDNALAFSNGEEIDIREVNLEDQVTVKLFDNKVVSVVLELGHGYVKLTDYDTFIGGTVEIGYDVIVPVTNDMLLTVREGDYKLRINKGGFSEYKNISVLRDEQVEVSLRELQIPYGNVTFEVTPIEAKVYISGIEIEGSSYYNLFGTYPLKIVADGYKTYVGSLKIKNAYEIKSYELTMIEEEEEEDKDEETEVTTTDSTTASSTSTTSEDPNTTANKVKVNAPIGAQVYVDGNYVGEAPISFNKVVGTHTITLYKSGCIIKSYTIESKDDGKNDEYSFDELTTLSELSE